MNQPEKVIIRKLPTGVPGLDEILGGGIPEFSFNIIAGAPGGGKTTLAHQFLFANATLECPALYFTILGEPAIKMLRYQQQYSFFDQEKLGNCIRFINLGDVLLEEGLEGVLKAVVKEVEATNPSIVVVDSFRTVARALSHESELQSFVQRLALHLTSWEATSFLVGEYTDFEVRNNPVFTVADAILWLSQVTDRNSVVRKLQVLKLRGQESVPGLHTVRISSAGVQAFPRTLGLTARKEKKPSKQRLSTGIPELDKMLDGGIPEGDSVVIAGSSGTGKSALATQFITAGLTNGECGIIAAFEERPDEYVSRAGSFGMKLEAEREKGNLIVLYLNPLDLSVNEAVQEILDAVRKTGAKRVVIDSLAGFELALAPTFRADFRGSLYRMIAALTGSGVTVLSTVEVEESFSSFPFSSFSISFLTDDLIRLRYVEIDGELRKVLVVVKMRGGNHSKAIREYQITSDGLVIIVPTLKGFRGLITGIPERIGRVGPSE
jgi:circadian clock protein KaiC